MDCFIFVRMDILGILVDSEFLYALVLMFYGLNCFVKFLLKRTKTFGHMF